MAGRAKKKKRSVLVVSGDADLVPLVENLNEQGFSAFLALSGSEALAFLTAIRTDLILHDDGMDRADSKVFLAGLEARYPDLFHLRLRPLPSREMEQVKEYLENVAVA